MITLPDEPRANEQVNVNIHVAAFETTEKVATHPENGLAIHRLYSPIYYLFHCPQSCPKKSFYRWLPLEILNANCKGRGWKDKVKTLLVLNVYYLP